MPRASRIVAAGGIYHVYARGNRRGPIFLDDRDRSRFLGLLAKEVARRRWGCRSYCLMTNHFHLVLELSSPNLSIGMQMLMGVYARWFNWRRGLDGHLFDRRFSSVTVETTEHFVELARYLALNPVRAGLCDRPEDWRWGSYRASVSAGRREPFLDAEPLLACFGRTPRRARHGLTAFVAEGMG